MTADIATCEVATWIDAGKLFEGEIHYILVVYHSMSPFAQQQEVLQKPVISATAGAGSSHGGVDRDMMPPAAGTLTHDNSLSFTKLPRFTHLRYLFLTAAVGSWTQHQHCMR